jgi:hypothetical protein
MTKGRIEFKNGAVASAVLGAPRIMSTSTGSGGSDPLTHCERLVRDPPMRLRRTRVKSIENLGYRFCAAPGDLVQAVLGAGPRTAAIYLQVIVCGNAAALIPIATPDMFEQGRKSRSKRLRRWRVFAGFATIDQAARLGSPHR